MIQIQGVFNKAVCFCSELEKTAERQIQLVCDLEAFADSKIRIMPDVHAGMGCTIGTTMTITDKVVPGMVGVDIGCGMETVRIEETELDFERLDNLIRRSIPCGHEIRSTPHPLNGDIKIESLRCAANVNIERGRSSIGTLGGGNHFIEVDRGEEGALYIVVHSGSRHIGNQVAKYYQEEAYRALNKKGGSHRYDNADIHSKSTRILPIPKDLSYVEGELFDDYIHDMNLIQKYALLNRKAMMDVILKGTGVNAVENFTTIHNYIDTDSMILRKGAVSAKNGEKLLIPINMRDGSLICIGRGNADWNFSAPHGAGRIMSRSDAFRRLSMEEYIAVMKGIYTTCVISDTLDESPMAYKNMDEIITQIRPTVNVVNHIKPLYNFKAAE